MVQRITMPALKLGVLAMLAVAAALLAGLAGASADGSSGSVYSLTNDASNNQVAIFDRANDGTLTLKDTIDTGGLGTGGGLGSQGAIALQGRTLVAVNPGSDSISLFAVQHDGGLKLLDVAGSGGDQPISVTIHRRRVYVLNAGAPENITGFVIFHGHLLKLPGSSRPLSGSGVGAAQVQFSPSGRLLLVTEKGTNQIDTYFVGFFGYAYGPRVQPSVGETPFGFAFADRNTVVVSEAFGGNTDASTVSSYDVSFFGNLDPVTESAPTTETAACWIAISKNGRFAYSTNTGSSSVTGFRVNHNGELAILDADGATGQTGPGSKPIDAAFSGNGRYLYVLSAGTNTVTAFEFHSDGSLTSLGSTAGLPAGAVGLAAN